jgi:DNA-binding NarL/FixJ family response regulator
MAAGAANHGTQGTHAMVNVKATKPGSDTFSLPEQATPIWSALCDDANTAVMVLDGDGNVHFANHSAERLCGKPSDDQAYTLRSIWSEDFAKERLDHLRECAATGRVITVDGMIRGRFMRCVFRPLPPESLDRRRVLLVARPSTPTSGAEAGVIRARIDDTGPLAGLTSREIEILRLIGSGLSTADIADKLHRSVKTIEWHRVSLGNKLGVSNRVELARIAINAGLVGVSNVITER